MRYRPAAIADLTLLSVIEAECFNQDDRFSTRSIKRMLLNPQKSILVDVILENEKIIGYAVFFTRSNSQRVRLYSICILPQYSGKGYGKAYLTSRIADFWNDFREISLEVRCTNSKALALYNNLGFQIIKTLTAYYPDDENGYRLVKRLE